MKVKWLANSQAIAGYGYAEQGKEVVLPDEIAEQMINAKKAEKPTAKKSLSKSVTTEEQDNG